MTSATPSAPGNIQRRRGVNDGTSALFGPGSGPSGDFALGAYTGRAIASALPPTEVAWPIGTDVRPSFRRLVPVGESESRRPPGLFGFPEIRPGT